MNNQDTMDRYEEALAKARQAIKDCGDNEGRKQMIYGIFPELAESEDERIVNFLYCELTTLCAKECNEGGNGSDRYNTLVAAMAWLEKQKEQKGSLRVIKDASEWENIKEQKPAEWSEEDNNYLLTCFEILCGANPAPYTESVKRAAINWLKSLRPQPHWKPSEEQMDALKNSAYGTYQNGDGPTLRELYEQLKKLH